jgi:hypothetical protein
MKRAFHWLFCRIFGHETYYSKQRLDPQSGYLLAYEISCQTCSAVIAVWHQERLA